jgi:tRNA(Ile)-lysidine synthase TilS/MesJ
MDFKEIQTDLREVKKRKKEIEAIIVKPLKEWSEREILEYCNHDKLREREERLDKRQERLEEMCLKLIVPPAQPST